MSVKLVFTIILFLIAGKVALADDYNHQHKKLVTIQMRTQHNAMAVIESEWNAAKHAEFISEYHLFVKHVSKLKDKISGQDISTLDNELQEVQDSCIRCHAKFR